MALQAAYRQFLHSPNSSQLAADAALYYVTTLTVVHGATEIIKHLSSQHTQLKKKKEAFLSAVESSTGLAVEVDTTIEFLTGGSAYLPRLDDNFLADRVVYLPITHFVSFNADGKILQIRQSWDQGALLKQIEVIGKSGRNWPIHDGAEQAKLIAGAVGVSGVEGAAAATSSAASAAAAVPAVARSRGNSNAMRDPHASLELFATRDELESVPDAVVAPYAGVRPRQRDVTEILHDEPTTDDEDAVARSVISPYAGRRPRQRSFTEILGDDDEDDEQLRESADNGSPSSRGYAASSRGRSRSPSKVVAPKAGLNRKFQPVRVFEADEAAAAALDANSPGASRSPERSYRPHPKKFNHFDFADGSDPQDAPKAGVTFDTMPKSKHASHWSYDDFATPQKPPPRPPRGQEVRHFALGGDEVPETPSAASRKPAPVRPRRDAEKHFEFEDDGVPSGDPRPAARPRGAGHNDGLGLYENNLYKEDGSAPTPGPARALGNITNLRDRSKIFEAHFTMTDEAQTPTGAGPTAAPIGDDRVKAVKMMESSWASTFEDDAAGEQKENNNPIPGTNIVANDSGNRGIQVGGDGMGGKKSGRSWSFGDDDDAANASGMGPSIPGKKQGTANQASDFWDF
ncbi:hypothetical protein SPI_06258 [Niveomyces insectorum RCEF 264]|uniref:Ntf2-like protein n=1 Tax=Niveomyces insectorum RCEF 264 TaxID=1081102 RepID=A0A167RYB4_9HYPO|nr:hypothetical protein SPI_06258 [Niveomyces insectorum RCEF 264]